MSIKLKWLVLNKQAFTLKAAKEIAKDFLNRHPDYWHPEYRW